MATIKTLKADAQFCDNCRMCELVCSLTKAGVVNPFLARLKVGRSQKDGAPRPIICRHCTVAQCQLACPVPGAMYVDESTGALVIDDATCTRCMDCVLACPFEAIWVGPNGEILKCDLCQGDPVCVANCPSRPERRRPDRPYGRQSCLKYVQRRRRQPSCTGEDRFSG